MVEVIKIYGLYKGDELLAKGTLEQIAEEENVAVTTLRHYSHKGYQKKHNSVGRRFVNELASFRQERKQCERCGEVLSLNSRYFDKSLVGGGRAKYDQYCKCCSELAEEEKKLGLYKPLKDKDRVDKASLFPKIDLDAIDSKIGSGPQFGPDPKKNNICPTCSSKMNVVDAKTYFCKSCLLEYNKNGKVIAPIY